MTEKTAESNQQVLAVHRIYTKSSLFESIQMTKSILQKPPQPIVDMQTQVNFQRREEEEDLYETVLSLHLFAKVDGNLLWRLQIQQAALYTVKGFTEDQLKLVLNGYCMNQIYPYACAAISAAVVQAGFLPVYLTPINFEMVYREQLKKEEQEAKQKAAETMTH